MRVVAGEAGGRRLYGGPRGVRPTGERARTSLFDALAGWIEGRAVLDLCAGTGALGIEALSRGARRALFVDIDPAAVRVIHDNLRLCRFSDRTAVWLTSFQTACQHLTNHRCVFDLILADPPYDSNLHDRIVEIADRMPLLSRDGLLVIEHRKSESPAAPAGNLHLPRIRQIGDTAFSCYPSALARPHPATDRPLSDIPPPGSRRRR